MEFKEAPKPANLFSGEEVKGEEFTPQGMKPKPLKAKSKVQEMLAEAREKKSKLKSSMESICGC